jgi:hypothetical protein
MDIMNYELGRLPKTKYKLYIGNHLLYWFVTTKLTQEEAVDALVKKVEDKVYEYRKDFRITSIVDGEETTIHTFKAKLLYL